MGPTAHRSNGSLKWCEVTVSKPCPKCRKPDWCAISDDGDWCCCRRLDDGTGKRKADQAGGEFWL